jgi:hypothetical protein
MIIEPRPETELRVSLICGSVITADLSQSHEDWHAAISGEAIEQTNLVDQLQRQITAITGGAA